MLSFFLYSTRSGHGLEGYDVYFLWEGNDVRRSFHLLAWDSMSFPKMTKVLEVGNIDNRNRALMAKCCGGFHLSKRHYGLSPLKVNVS